MKIAGYIKTSMIDYPNELTSVVFTPGCNFRCSYCHNKDLIVSDDLKLESEVIEHLKKRRNILDGVVITGGEPTLQEDIKVFCMKVKSLGYKIKLDTNGSNPEVISELLKYKLIDYIAMDIKSSISEYNNISQVIVDIEKVKDSIDLIKSSTIDYEFRMTLIKEFHTIEIIEAMFNMISHSKKLALQQYHYSSEQINDVSYNAYTKEEMSRFKSKFQVRYNISNVIVRGKY
jgi:pyruvate formate lyase activating enzyme